MSSSISNAPQDTVDNPLNATVSVNFSKVKPALLYLPLFFLIAIVLFLYSQDSLSVAGYVNIQKDLFLAINAALSQYPNTIFNLTQLGDAMIVLSLLTLFIMYAPKLWEALLSASLVSALFSNVLKKFFAIPRPAAVLDTDSFTIIGKTLTGHNSLPSGHSITVFTILTVVLFAFMPKKASAKFLWCLVTLGLGIVLVLTRIGVGAHYPLDVTTGSILGFASGVLGILISRQYKIWNWIGNKKYYPVFMLLFVVCGVLLITKISKENLVVYYVALASLLVSLYKISTLYVKK